MNQNIVEEKEEIDDDGSEEGLNKESEFKLNEEDIEMIMSCQDSSIDLQHQNMKDKACSQGVVHSLAMYSTPAKLVKDNLSIQKEAIEEDSFQLSQLSKSELNGIMG